ncbi:CRISPR-associated endonuclease Cas1 [Thermoleptolyngbya sp. C42_A2020_037]|uniref:CRISPR-associated endonuclease Cas1 n=1 Tax=Thermoleptolyngbya sp. C42_A2020_037 TaxID=2747799 RepID=UPI0019F3D674|nr:CRISPR-associated endonuclease Cas1 [Thermoleptolyngbya sp. C42_A2020_037]MBF2087007.1 CRISPR-associated endonuclease Cas1 [Thermoleptolyngbya sp. C42_A2020_037]
MPDRPKLELPQLDWQRFLSAENFWQSWLKVRRNRGCAGVDGETVEAFEQDAERKLATLRRQIETGTYQPLPLRSLHIPKKPRPKPGEPPKTEWRGLSVPTVRDRIVQQALLNLLHPLLEPQFENSSFAYRPGRSYKSAVQQIDQWRQQGYDWVLDADVVKYFDNIQHRRLFDELQERVHDPAIGHLVERWIGSGVSTAAGLILPNKGVPQGAVISPILANVYFDDFDEAIEAAGLKLVRYADDFVILAKSKARIERAYDLVASLLHTMGLELHPDKTRVTTFNEGFRFLGHTFVRSLVVQDQPKTRQQRQLEQTAIAQKATHPEASPILHHSDPPPQTTQMQQALLAAIQTAEQPIPPPLYVVMGYRVRDEKPVQIESKEWSWKNGMSTLYLVRQGTMLRKDHGRFVIEGGRFETDEDESLTAQSPPSPPPTPKSKTQNPQSKTPEPFPPLEIPIKEVGRILVLGNVQISTSALSECLEHQIPVVFMSRAGDYKGHLWSSEFCDLPTEAAQFGRRHDPRFQVKMAQQILHGKLTNSRHLLLRLNRKRKVEGLSAKIHRIDQHIAALTKTTDLDAMRGHEGASARLYFTALGQLITNPGFSLTERNRRPPKDPVNSLLSFGYTLLFNNVLSLILAEGLNPYLGNLHRSDRKEPHLAFDLMEEWRSPIVDSLVMWLINKKAIRPTDFTFPNAEGGVYLENAARRVFLKHFEDRITETVTHPIVQQPVSYRRAIQLQIQRYKKCLQDSQPYDPFIRTI